MENDALSGKDEIESKIKELEDGLMEIARTVGRLKGELKQHRDEPDAHNPGTIARNKNAN